MSNVSAAVATFGIVLNVGGIVLAVGAFLHEHRARGLGPVWPWFTRQRSHLRTWAFRVFRKREDVNIVGAVDTIDLGFTMEASGYVWQNRADDDDEQAWLAKIVTNVETLRKRMDKEHPALRELVEGLHNGVDTRFGELEQRLSAQEATDAAITSRAIRLQVLGLVLASVGGLVTTFATLGS